MDSIEKNLLAEISDLHSVPEGAYNIRNNGKLEARNTTANIDIVTKKQYDSAYKDWLKEKAKSNDKAQKDLAKHVK